MIRFFGALYLLFFYIRIYMLHPALKALHSFCNDCCTSVFYSFDLPNFTVDLFLQPLHSAGEEEQYLSAVRV